MPYIRVSKVAIFPRHEMKQKFSMPTPIATCQFSGNLCFSNVVILPYPIFSEPYLLFHGFQMGPCGDLLAQKFWGIKIIVSHFSRLIKHFQ